MYGMLYSKVQLQTPVHGESCMVCYIVKFNSKHLYMENHVWYVI